MLAKHIVENNKCITYLRTCLRQGEERIVLRDRECKEDMSLLKTNHKRQAALLEDRIIKLNMQSERERNFILDLKKEMDMLKAENEGVIANIHKGMKDIATYHQMHSTLLGAENQMLRQDVKDDEKSATVFYEFIKNVSSDTITAVNRLVADLKSTSRYIGEQTTNLETIIKNLRVIDHVERDLVRNEVDNFRKAVMNVRSMILADPINAKETIVELKLFIDQLGRNTDDIAQNFERQVNRFVELNKVNQSKQRVF